MFKKVLAVEDYESAGISVRKTLEDLQIMNAQFASYCDEALNSVIENNLENNPFDLLITDLSFEKDHKVQNITSGAELIAETRKLLPDLKILVFSSEKRPQKIQFLFDELAINGFVSKGRLDVKELKKAIHTLDQDEVYLSQINRVHIRKNAVIELTTLQYTTLHLLSEGILQKDIPAMLKNKGMKPNSLSSVEKILNHLKESLGANSTEHLIAICKDSGIL